MVFRNFWTLFLFIFLLTWIGCQHAGVHRENDFDYPHFAARDLTKGGIYLGD
jgi:hypothetical protein